jgi:hypothetical protein
MNSSAIGGNILGIALSVIILICIIAAAYFLNQIRDILREMQKTQRAIALKLGARIQ